MRDYATVEQLLVLSNLENTNALFIEQGYTFVPVSELIYKDHYHMDHEGRQIRN